MASGCSAGQRSLLGLWWSYGLKTSTQSTLLTKIGIQNEAIGRSLVVVTITVSGGSDDTHTSTVPGGRMAHQLDPGQIRAIDSHMALSNIMGHSGPSRRSDIESGSFLISGHHHCPDLG